MKEAYSVKRLPQKFKDFKTLLLTNAGTIKILKGILRKPKFTRKEFLQTWHDFFHHYPTAENFNLGHFFAAHSGKWRLVCEWLLAEDAAEYDDPNDPQLRRNLSAKEKGEIRELLKKVLSMVPTENNSLKHMEALAEAAKHHNQQMIDDIEELAIYPKEEFGKLLIKGDQLSHKKSNLHALTKRGIVVAKKEQKKRPRPDNQSVSSQTPRPPVARFDNANLFSEFATFFHSSMITSPTVSIPQARIPDSKRSELRQPVGSAFRLVKKARTLSAPTPSRDIRVRGSASTPSKAKDIQTQGSAFDAYKPPAGNPPKR